MDLAKAVKTAEDAVLIVETTKSQQREQNIRNAQTSNELSQIKAQFQILSERERSVEQLQRLEDWIIQLLNLLDGTVSGERIFTQIGKPELTSRKSWAERLLQDDSL